MKNPNLFNNPTLSRSHPTGTGTQMIYKFANGYGASVVRFAMPIGRGYGSYTDNEKEWELAVLKFDKNDDSKNGKPKFELVYDTKITDDVMGHLLEKDVEEILLRIKKL